ncbi:MAG TPA: prepilin-type N-terminal cleavage/methylation domain-containing protein [Gaiellaceae bacterium]|jgi:prepilin-type N-terminal cleavage/methylation domain-containing protein|nr:prepilin-type N-terminal cleavage/methylation domain-containing protein [Gaiellaceae bacterium]
MRKDGSAAEQGFTLIELLIVLTIIGILVAIPISSYLGYRARANDAVARANVHVIVPAIEAFHVDHDESYVGMTLDALKADYDKSIDPARYTLSSLSKDGYCVSSTSGDKSWKKAGPGVPYAAGTCP